MGLGEFIDMGDWEKLHGLHSALSWKTVDGERGPETQREETDTSGQNIESAGWTLRRTENRRRRERQAGADRETVR